MMRARLEIPAVRMLPTRPGLAPNQVQDLALRNAEPILVEYDGKAVHIRTAHLVGRDTDLRASGAVNLNDKSPWDLRVDGTLNLGVLQDFHSDVVSSGMATINGSVRGSMRDPQLAGRMELKAASFYLTDIPNGLDNANGVILFDPRRATVESLRPKREAAPSPSLVSSASEVRNRAIVYKRAPITSESGIPKA